MSSFTITRDIGHDGKWARLFYLTGMIGSLGLLRLLAGLLLALAPLAAGMLLFDATRGLFAGWLRGLVLTLVGLVGVTVVLAVELAILEPFLRDALYVRGSGYAAPSAPIELFAIAAGFALVQLGMIWLLAKVVFTRGWLNEARGRGEGEGRGSSGTALTIEQRLPAPLANRAERIAQQVENRMSFEQNRTIRLPASPGAGPVYAATAAGPGSSPIGGTRRSEPASLPERLGSSYRRSASSRSLSSRRRDA